MEDFKTIEGATALFKAKNALGKENCIFVLYLDTQHEGMKYGIAGGMAGGLAAGLGVGVGVSGAGVILRLRISAASASLIRRRVLSGT